MTQALYRKYRPKTFAELTGQEHIARVLHNAVKSNRVVHSYLFTGPRGIGKTTVARLLAKAVNCAARPEGEAEPCNECENCKAMNAGNAMNIIEIDAASNTGVDNVREKIIENIRFAPSGSKYRVFIIDEAHMLSGSAFNALLKTLEEPPAHTIFILATTELQKVPATIVSRCQRFDFKNFTVKEIVGRLEKIAGAENIKVGKKVLERIAYLSEGGLRDAESLLGQLLSLGTERVGEEEADLVLPKSDMDTALNFLDCLVKKNGRGALLLLDKMAVCGTDFKYFFGEVIDLARELLHFKITGVENGFFTAEINAAISSIAGGATLQEIIKILDTLTARRGDLRVLDIPSFPLELAAAEICGEPGEINNSEFRATNEEMRSENGTAVINVVPGDLAEIEEKWPEVMMKIKDYNHSLPFILGFAKPIAFDGKTLTLAIKFKLHKEKLDDAKSRFVLTSVLKSVYNKDIVVASVVDETLPGGMPAAEDVPAEQAFG